MELKTQVKALNYTKKLLYNDTDSLLAAPFAPAKPAFSASARQLVPLPRSAPEAEGVPSELLEDLLRRLAALPQAKAHSLLVLRHGRVICEAGFAPYSTGIWHVSHSLCKSITGLAVGILADEGLLKTDETICSIFPEQVSLFTSRRMRAVTVEHLLTMSSGVSFREAGAVLETDWLRSYFEADVAFDPGSKFDYNSLNTYVLAAIVQRRSGQGLVEYLTPRLFEPLGFGPFAWEKCPRGVEKGGWGMYLLPEDMAKLGLLCLNGGVWQTPEGEKRLISAEWLARASSTLIQAPDSGYGYQIWAFADGSYTFNGMFGQYVLCLPQNDMVVCLTSGSANLFAESGAFALLREVFLAPLPAAPLPENAPAAASLARLAGALCFERPAPQFAPPPAPAPWYSRLWQSLFTPKTKAPALPAPAPAAQKAAELLAGRTFLPEKNRTGLLPMVMQCMQGNYTPGVSRLTFASVGDTLRLSWQEGEAVYVLPLDFSAPRRFALSVRGEEWQAATVAALAENEDDIPVLKFTLCFPEHSSCRHFKLFLFPEGAQLRLDESPSPLHSLEQLKGTGPLLDTFRDIDYAQWRVDKLFSPVLSLQEQPAAPPAETPPAPAAEAAPPKP